MEGRVRQMKMIPRQIIHVIFSRKVLPAQKPCPVFKALQYHRKGGRDKSPPFFNDSFLKWLQQANKNYTLPAFLMSGYMGIRHPVPRYFQIRMCSCWSIHVRRRCHRSFDIRCRLPRYVTRLRDFSHRGIHIWGLIFGNIQIWDISYRGIRMILMREIKLHWPCARFMDTCLCRSARDHRMLIRASMILILSSSGKDEMDLFTAFLILHINLNLSAIWNIFTSLDDIYSNIHW